MPPSEDAASEEWLFCYFEITKLTVHSRQSPLSYCKLRCGVEGYSAVKPDMLLLKFCPNVYHDDVSKNTVLLKC